jgi:hypothetical protein
MIAHIPSHPTNSRSQTHPAHPVDRLIVGLSLALFSHFHIRELERSHRHDALLFGRVHERVQFPVVGARVRAAELHRRHVGSSKGHPHTVERAPAADACLDCVAQAAEGGDAEEFDLELLGGAIYEDNHLYGDAGGVEQWHVRRGSVGVMFLFIYFWHSKRRAQI